MGSGASLATAALLPTFLFAMVHVVPFSKESRHTLAVLLLEVFVLGLVLSYVTAITNSLIPAIVGHAAANGGGIVAFYAMKRAKPRSPSIASYIPLELVIG